jgi:hypothetical protein
MRFLRDAARWLLLAALLYAPWAYGCTTAKTIVGLNWILGIALGCWVIDLAVVAIIGRENPSLPSVPRLLAIVTVALLLFGWWAALNASAIYDSEFGIFAPIKKLVPFGPSSVDHAISRAWMTRATLLLGAAWVAADLSHDRRWLLRLWWTIAGGGVSIALLGLLQKGTGAKMIFWQPGSPWWGGNFFATYFYHANAGAFLNLVLPAVAGLTIRSFTKHETPVVRAAWLSSALILFVAFLSNTSRVGQLIGVLLIGLIALGPGRPLIKVAAESEKITVLIGAVVVIVGILALVQASHLERSLLRWQQLSEQFARDSRWLAAVAALPAVRDAGWFGFGPGTFRVVFPHYADLATHNLGGVWRFLHQDYLQTLMEWGWLGGFLWGVFFFGGMTVAIRNLKSQRSQFWRPRQRLFIAISLLALGGIAVHAALDFPLQIASIQLYVATYLGICWGSSGWRSEKEKSRTAK